MGFSFRKSLKFGPFRVNLSKSGIGVSAGVKGARISTGPRGTYINAGRGGFNYRQKLNVGSGSSSGTAQQNNQNWLADTIEVPQGKLVESIKAPEKSSLPSTVQIIYLALTAGCIGWAAWQGVTLYPHTADGRTQLGTLLFTLPWSVWLAGSLIHYFVKRSYSVETLHPLYYELDEQAKSRFEMIKAACFSLAQSQKLGALPAMPSYSYLRPGLVSAWITQKQPPMITTNVEIWAITLGNWSMFFFPDNIYVFNNNSYATISYDTLKISFAEGRAIENGSVPSDAQIVDRTWLHTRKDGLPDMRYNHNPSYPIVLYGLIHLESTNGWNLILQASNTEACIRFVSQLSSVLPGRNQQRSHRTSNSQGQQKQREDSPKSKTSAPLKSPYEVLGLNPGATLDEITAAFRRQATMNHPDKVANLAPEFKELAERRMKEINEAYQELKRRFQ